MLAISTLAKAKATLKARRSTANTRWGKKAHVTEQQAEQSYDHSHLASCVTLDQSTSGLSIVQFPP